MSVPHSLAARPGPQPLPPPLPLGEDRVSLLRIGASIMRHRLLVAGVALLAFAAVVTRILLAPRTYTAESTFVSQSTGGSSTLSGLASQFGFQLPMVEPGRSPEFYADLVTSRQILGAVVDTAFVLPGRGPVTLLEIYEPSGETPELRRDAAILQLRDDLSTEVNLGTGTVTVRASAIDPHLALRLNRRVLDLLNQFNLTTRQSQAAMERRFTEGRLEEVRRELRQAEDRQQAFLQRNRDFQNSPELVFQGERLAREVAMRQQLYTVLAESYERAKIDEVRDTPVITVVEAPELPVRPDRRGLLKWGLAALLGGVVLGTILALVKDAIVRSREDEPLQFAELAELWRSSRDDLLHPWRPLQRLVRGRRAG